MKFIPPSSFTYNKQLVKFVKETKHNSKGQLIGEIFYIYKDNFGREQYFSEGNIEYYKKTEKQ